jgi:hypothetical protein
LTPASRRGGEGWFAGGALIAAGTPLPRGRTAAGRPLPQGRTAAGTPLPQGKRASALPLVQFTVSPASNSPPGVRSAEVKRIGQRRSRCGPNPTRPHIIARGYVGWNAACLPCRHRQAPTPVVRSRGRDTMSWREHSRMPSILVTHILFTEGGQFTRPASGMVRLAPVGRRGAGTGGGHGWRVIPAVWGRLGLRHVQPRASRGRDGTGEVEK